MGIELQKQWIGISNSIAMAKKQKIQHDNITLQSMIHFILSTRGLGKSILMFLDLKSLLRCRVVCKQWNEVIEKSFHCIWKNMDEISKFEPQKTGIDPSVFDDPLQWMKSKLFIKKLLEKGIKSLKKKSLYDLNTIETYNTFLDGEDFFTLCCYSGKIIEKKHFEYKQVPFYKSLKFKPPEIRINCVLKEERLYVRLYTRPKDGFVFARDTLLSKNCVFVSKQRYIETHWIIPILVKKENLKDNEYGFELELELIAIPCEKGFTKNAREYISNTSKEDLFSIVKTNIFFGNYVDALFIRCINKRGSMWCATKYDIIHIQYKKEKEFSITNYNLAYKENRYDTFLFREFKMIFGVPTLIDGFSLKETICTRIINEKIESNTISSNYKNQNIKLYEKGESVVISFDQKDTIILNRRNWERFISNESIDAFLKLPNSYTIIKTHPIVIYQKTTTQVGVLLEKSQYFFSDQLLWKEKEIEKLASFSKKGKLKLYAYGFIVLRYHCEKLYLLDNNYHSKILSLGTIRNL